METPKLYYPEDIVYTDEHIWARLTGEIAEIGISDFAQDQLGEIAFVDLPEVGRRLDAGQDFGTVESLKSVNSLYCPYAGDVIAVNGKLEDSPTVINVDPYGEGWMIKLRCDHPLKSVALLDARAYLDFWGKS